MQTKSETKQINKLEIVNRLVGEISAVGDSSADSKRYENLKEFGTLTYEMVDKLCEETRNTNSSQSSVKRSGDYAVKQLKAIQERIEDALNIL